MSATERTQQLERYEDPAAVNSAVEEIFSSLTHAIGVGLSIAGLVVLLILTGRDLHANYPRIDAGTLGMGRVHHFWTLAGNVSFYLGYALHVA